MTSAHRRRALIPGLLLTSLLALAACDGDPTAPPFAPTVIQGQLQAAAAVGAGSAGMDGYLVSVEGGASADTTDANGAFRVEATSDDGRVRLRFRKGSTDVSIELEGVEPGTVLTITVDVSGSNAVLTGSGSSRTVEFDGIGRLLAVDGQAPARTLRVHLDRDDDDDDLTDVDLEILEGQTTIHVLGDLVTFDRLVDALRAGVRVEMEGRASRRDDGTWQAVSLKAETDSDDDGNDDDGKDDNPGVGQEYDGDARLVSVTGTALERVLRLEANDKGRIWIVDVRETGTTIAQDGDLKTFQRIVDALTAGRPVKVEGRATQQQDGTWMASTIKAETDD